MTNETDTVSVTATFKSIKCTNLYIEFDKWVILVIYKISVSDEFSLDLRGWLQVLFTIILLLSLRKKLSGLRDRRRHM
jgi:hypothetical protein